MESKLQRFKEIKIRNLGIWFLISFAILIVISFFSYSLNINLEDPTVLTFLGSLAFYGTLLFWIIFSFRKQSLTLKELVGRVKQKRDFLNILLVFPLFILSIGSFFLLFWVLSYIFPDYVSSVLNDQIFLDQGATATPIIYNILEVLLGLIIAPIVEEIFFRGVLLHRWSLKWGIKRGLLFSAILFGILHASVIGGFLFGLLMGVLYLKTKNLVVNIIFHFINNLFAYTPSLISLFQGTVKVENYSVETFRQDASVGFIFVAVSAPVIFYFLYKNFPTDKTKLPIEG